MGSWRFCQAGGTGNFYGKPAGEEWSPEIEKAGVAPEGGNQGAGKLPVLPESGWGRWDGLEHLKILDTPWLGSGSFF